MSVAHNKHLTNKPEADGGARSRKESHTWESNSRPPVQKAAYQPTVLIIPPVNRFLRSRHPPTPLSMLWPKKHSFLPTVLKIQLCLRLGGERSLVLLIPLEKVPMLLTSIVANRKQFKPQLSVACMFMSKTHRLASSVFCISHSVARFCFS